MHYKYYCSMTCSQEIDFDYDGDRVTNIVFTGGCNGNLKAIAKLCEGMHASDIIKKIKGNTCGPRPTSCADQFAKALIQASEDPQWQKK